MKALWMLVSLLATAGAFFALFALVGPRRLFAAAPKRAMVPSDHAEKVHTLHGGAFLWAIAQVETGCKPELIGKAGERGRCQFLRTTWRQYTTVDFALASRDSAFTRKIERAHLDYLCRKLFPQGEPEPALLAAAWRHGPGSAVNHVRSEYAVRVTNLYWEAAR